MDKKESTLSSDDEHFEDANEKIVNDLIKEATGISPNSIKNKLKGKHNLEINEELENSEDDFDEKEDSEHEDHEKESFEDCETNDFIDDESQKDFEQDLSLEETETRKLKAEELKKQGNEHFKTGEYEKSSEIYTSALRICPVSCSTERSVLYANRAAAKGKLNLKPAAIDDCTKAIEFNPNYVKALLRRAALYEESDKLDESLADYKKILEIDPSNNEANLAQIRLPPLVNERNEKMKDEMIDKLKDLGNMILKPFGLSTSNFQMKQDPSTGSYSVNFNQKQ